MNLGGLDVFVETVSTIATCATLVVIIVAAAYGAQHGAQQGATIKRKVSAVLCGGLGGLVVAAMVGLAVLSANALEGLVLCLILCPLFGGATSYGMARSDASWTKPSEE
jgi:hypothetical protein